MLAQALEPRNGMLPFPYRRPLTYQQRGEIVFRGIKEYLEANPSNDPISIYCHIPFCRTRCVFCDLYTFTISERNTSRVEEYVNALTLEITLWGNIPSLRHRPVTTVHFGGGTPSCIPTTAITQILNSLRKNFNIDDQTEIAMEITGSDLNRLYRSFLRDSGINRIHLGVQSLNDVIRRKMCRKDTAEKLLKKISDTLTEGFILSVDLIFGLPGQTQTDFIEDIKKLTKIGVHGFSLYELQIPKNNPHGLNRMPDFKKDRTLNYLMFQAGKSKLESQGYEQSYFVHFSLPPDKNLYCLYPVRGEDCLAFGTISDGIVGNWVFINSHYDEYMKSVTKDQSGIGQGFLLNEKERTLRALETELLTTAVSGEMVKKMKGFFYPSFGELFDCWVSADFVRKDASKNQYRLTGKGCWCLGNMFNELRQRVFSDDRAEFNLSTEKRGGSVEISKADSNPDIEISCNRDISLNEELFVIPDGDNYILYAPFEKGVLLVNKAAVRTLQDFKKGIRNGLDPDSDFFKQLIQAGMLVTGKESCQRFPKDQAGFDPGGLSLFLTTRCSMRCIYCYSNGGESPRVMPWETAKAAIDWIINHIANRGKDRFYVSFHGGGEVVTTGALMKRCVEYIRQQTKAHGVTAQIDAGLNGVMDERMVDWIVENLDGATVSLDGLPDIQNLQRPLSNGQGSFDLVSATLQRMDERGFRYSIRATVTHKGMERLVDSVEFVCKNFGAKVIQVEPIFQVGRALTNKLPPVDPKGFVEGHRKALRVARTYGKELKYSGARIRTTTNIFCKATGSSFAVTPDSLVTSCYEVSNPDDPRASLFFYGRLDYQTGQFIFDHEKIERLSSLTVENKPYCKNCFCKWHCAGDCPAKLALLGDAWDSSINPRCYINQELTKDQIKEYLYSHSAINVRREG